MQLAAAIVADDSFPTPAQVMLTSRGERLAQAKMDAAGLAACELKPLHPERLHRTLGRVLGARQARIHPPAETAAPAPVAAALPLILAVEDNPVNQKVIRLMLSKLGYAVDIAANGQEAIAALRRKTYEVVLMDEHMPIMDGFATTRYIRQAQAAGTHGFPPGLRIIAMTANAMNGDREACLAAGMDDYLSKPVKTEILREMLARNLPAKSDRVADPESIAS
jgi:CheY-like chemotaxis protein